MLVYRNRQFRISKKHPLYGYCTLSPVQLQHLAFKDFLPVLTRAQLLLCFGFFAAEVGKIGFGLDNPRFEEPQDIINDMLYLFYMVIRKN